MSDYDNTGRAAAWRPKSADHPLSVKCHAHRDIRKGEEFEVAIWKAKDKRSERSPDYTGKVQDKFVPRGSHEPQQRQDFSDDIPF